MYSLNLGCGNRVYKFYPTDEYKCINLDEREMPGVDMVSDVHKLYFPDSHFDFILASDIIEHFPFAETEVLIKEWSRVLRVGGRIEIRTPNMRWMLRTYKEGKNCKFVSWHIFGGQDYPGNFHYVIFDREWLNDLFKAIGFKEVSYDEVGSNFILVLEKIR